MMLYSLVFVTVIQIVCCGELDRQDSKKLKCIVPNPPANGRLSILSGNPGDEVPPGTVIEATCHGEYKLEGASLSLCLDGKWSEKTGECLINQDVNRGRVRRQDSTQKECIVPNPPANGRLSILGTRSRPNPGDQVPPATVIATRCNGQYKLEGASLSICSDGKWSENIGQCLILCPPITPTTGMEVKCTSPNGNTTDNCNTAINGTVATLKCVEYYEDLELNRDPFRRCTDGKWNKELPNCRPICGVKSKEKSAESNSTYYPWNVGIFRLDSGNPKFRCAGSLISENTILTTANCVTNDKQKPIEPLTVGAGKSSGVFNDSRDSVTAQFAEVDEVFIPRSYKGHVRKYVADIAVLTTKTPFKITKYVQPVCVDWELDFEEEFVYPGTVGFIPGPLRSEFFPNLTEVIDIEVPFVNNSVCYKQLAARDVSETDFQAFFTYDKICSGPINEDKSPKCMVNTGAGLVSKPRLNDKYYITGIAALYPSIHGSDCNNKKFVLFTDLSKYIDSLIAPKSKLSPTMTKRAHLQASCGVKSVQATTLIVNGHDTIKGDYPWQVAIYVISKNRKILSCGGSMLNPRVILTAAHCVTDIRGKQLSKELFAVTVGKYYNSFDDPRDTDAQFSSVQEIFVPHQYQGIDQNFVADIAVIVTVDSFFTSRYVQPVCIDWDDKYQNQFLTKSSKGFVVGWGYTEEDDSPSEVLKDLEVPYVDEQTCINELPVDFEVYLTFDKLCSGFTNKSVSVCRGDSGGGLVFKNKRDNRYYIVGIVSLSPQSSSGGCDSQRYGLYTRVSKYISSFILDKVRQYWA